MAFTVLTQSFEGPLDLMLHLIKDNKLDLFDLDIDILCDQYLAYIETMEQLHLEVASEYLSELASLIEYKSKKLLPREKVVVEEEYEEDKREKLVQRLIEYQRYKEVSNNLKENYEERSLSYDKPISEEVSKLSQPIVNEEINGSPYDLVKAMQKVLRRMALNHPYETKMKIKELSLDERVVQVKERIRNLQDKMSFEVLCDDCDSKHMVIVTFLSILDLIKLKFIVYTIDEDEMIWISKGEGAWNN